MFSFGSSALQTGMVESLYSPVQIRSQILCSLTAFSDYVCSSINQTPSAQFDWGRNGMMTIPILLVRHSTTTCTFANHIMAVAGVLFWKENSVSTTS